MKSVFITFTTEALLTILREAGSQLQPVLRKQVRRELERRMGEIVNVLHDDTVRSTKKGSKR